MTEVNLVFVTLAEFSEGIFFKNFSETPVFNLLLEEIPLIDSMHLERHNHTE